MIRWLVILALAAAAIVPAPSQAQRCGDTLYSSTTLRHDIVCPAGSPIGLRIGAPNVTLDLAGFSIVVQTDIIFPHPFGWICTPTPTGIVVERASGVTIRNGRIRDVGACGRAVGLQIIASDASTIEDIEFSAARGTGIHGEGSSDLVVSRNHFDTPNAVWLRPDWRTGQRSDRARLVGNTMRPSHFSGGLFFLTADESEDTIAAHNIVEHTFSFVDARSSDGMRIFGNSIKASGLGGSLGAIAISNAQKALIEENWIDGGDTGIRLDGYGHVVRHNHVSVADTAVILGAGLPALNVTVTGNFLTTTNKQTGILFYLQAEYNDGRGNQFGSVATPVLDQGIGNIY